MDEFKDVNEKLGKKAYDYANAQMMRFQRRFGELSSRLIEPVREIYKSKRIFSVRITKSGFAYSYYECGKYSVVVNYRTLSRSG